MFAVTGVSKKFFSVSFNQCITFGCNADKAETMYLMYHKTSLDNTKLFHKFLAASSLQSVSHRGDHLFYGRILHPPRLRKVLLHIQTTSSDHSLRDSLNSVHDMSTCTSFFHLVLWWKVSSGHLLGTFVSRTGFRNPGKLLSIGRESGNKSCIVCQKRSRTTTLANFVGEAARSSASSRAESMLTANEKVLNVHRSRKRYPKRLGDPCVLVMSHGGKCGFVCTYG